LGGLLLWKAEGAGCRPGAGARCFFDPIPGLMRIFGYSFALSSASCLVSGIALLYYGHSTMEAAKRKRGWSLTPSAPGAPAGLSVSVGF
jgi:hypothetical protein